MEKLLYIHEATIKILKNIPNSTIISLYTLKKDTDYNLSSIKSHLEFLKELGLISIERVEKKGIRTYEIKLTALGSKVKANLN